MTNKELHLHVSILLLALRDDEGTFDGRTMYAYTMGAAVLSELLMAERIVVEEGKRKLVNVINPAPLEEPILDACLTKMVEAKRRANLVGWIARLANPKTIIHPTAQQLCRLGILREDEGKVLFFFKRRIYPEIDPHPERLLRERIEQAVLGETTELDPPTAVLVSLAHGSGLLRLMFDKTTLKNRKPHIERIVSGELTGKATREAIAAQQAAIAASVATSTMMTTMMVNR